MNGVISSIKMAPGLLYVAPAGSVEPSADSLNVPTVFRAIGYTKSGSTVSVATTTQPIEVPGLLDPVRHQVVKRETSLQFEMAQSDVTNLALALNGGGAVSASTKTLDAPDIGSDVRVMLLLVTQNNEFWLFRQCLNAGQLTVAFGKAPDYRVVPVEFHIEKPLNADAWSVLYPAN